MRISDWSSDVCSSDLHARRTVPADSACQPCGNAESARATSDRGDPDDELAIRSDPAIQKILPNGASEQIGRAPCRERVCQYVEISVVAVSLKKTKNRII